MAPWGKQHVFLFRGPRADLKAWKDPHHLLGLLKKHRLGKLFNARLPLVPPDKLTLSSVTHSDGKLRVTAVQMREYAERTPEHDEEKETRDGERLTLKAYVHHLTRTLAVFEWDLNANVAMLQVTQLQRDGDYRGCRRRVLWTRQLVAGHQAVRRRRPPSGDPQAPRDRGKRPGRGSLPRNPLSVAARQAGLGAQPEPAGLGARRGVHRQRDGQRSVLEGLTEAGVLREEEMVECPDCGMAVLRSDYDEALEEEDEYRCTSCDRRWEDGTAQAVITYRCGENWPEFPPDSVRETTAEPYVGVALAYPKEDRIFKNQGKTWLVVYDGVPKSVGDSVGMAYIRRLLQSPGQDTHAAAMRSSAAGETSTPILGSAGEVLDAQALREYKERISEIDEELAEAEANNDLARKESLDEERAALYAEVGRATGLHGKNREASSDRERARQAVSAAIHRALRAIKKEQSPSGSTSRTP